MVVDLRRLEVPTQIITGVPFIVRIGWFDVSAFGGSLTWKVFIDGQQVGEKTVTLPSQAQTKTAFTELPAIVATPGTHILSVAGHDREGVDGISTKTITSTGGSLVLQTILQEPTLAVGNFTGLLQSFMDTGTISDYIITHTFKCNGRFVDGSHPTIQGAVNLIKNQLISNQDSPTTGIRFLNIAGTRDRWDKVVESACETTSTGFLTVGILPPMFSPPTDTSDPVVTGPVIVNQIGAISLIAAIALILNEVSK